MIEPSRWGQSEDVTNEGFASFDKIVVARLGRPFGKCFLARFFFGDLSHMQVLGWVGVLGT